VVLVIVPKFCPTRPPAGAKAPALTAPIV